MSTLWGVSTSHKAESNARVLSPVLGTLYEICNGEPPFPTGYPDSESEAKKSTIQSYYDDDNLRKLIEECLKFDPKDRPEAQKMRDEASKKLKDIPKYRRALGYQSLLEAVKEGSVEEVKEKLKHFEMPGSEDGRSHTSLHRAVQYGKVNVVEMLLDSGFSPLARTEKDETPIHLALAEKSSSLPIILKLLLDHCDIRKLRDETYQPRRWTLVHFAAAANSIYFVKHVLENTEWIDSSEGPQWSLVHIAARMGHLDMLRFLMERQKGRLKAVMEQKSSDEATPLFAASKHGKADAVRLLLKEGAKIDVRASNIKIRANELRGNVTALHIAALGGHTEVIKILRDDRRKELIRAKTSQGETALHLAVQNNHQSCQEVIGALGKTIKIEERAILKDNKSTKERTALQLAVENGNFQGTLKLLELGANPNVETESEKRDTALHLAARKGLKAIAEALLDKGAQAGKANRAGDTPLHEAIKNSRHKAGHGKPILDKAATETAVMLIQKDEKLVSHKARHGEIALHLAANVGNSKVLEAAYRCNPALVNAQTTSFETALHVAARADRHNIVDFLLKKDADRKLKNEDGRRALDVANGESEAILEKWG